MKYKIEFHSIQSDHMLAMPELDYIEYIETNSPLKLKKYIESKKDSYGNYFKFKKEFGYDYISRAGGVKVKLYKPIKFTQL